MTALLVSVAFLGYDFWTLRNAVVQNAQNNLINRQAIEQIVQYINSQNQVANPVENVE